jgi:hypothetical protein
MSYDADRTEVNMCEMKFAHPEDPTIWITGVDGCTGICIWTANPKRVIALHVDSGDLVGQVRHGANEVKRTEKNSTVTAIAVTCPDRGDMNSVKSEFQKVLSNVNVQGSLYPYDPNPSKGPGGYYDFEARLGQPGRLVQHHIKPQKTNTQMQRGSGW